MPSVQRTVEIVTYGAINAMMAIPAFYGYAAIIFRHPIYAAHMPALAKLVVFSRSELKRLGQAWRDDLKAMFSSLSSLSFAIGQVQDAGLIFLSRMATHVALKCVKEGKTPDEAIATTLTATALGTLTLGLVLVLVGKVKLARYISFLPMPVVGGYLAFIGLFCLSAGLALASGKDVEGLETWGILLNERDLALCLPCVLCGVLWSWVSRRYNHFAVLPLTMLAVPVLFFGGLGMSGRNMQDARDLGIIGSLTEPALLSSSFALFRWNLVDWWALPSLIPDWLGMVFVVTFSSCLDVVAIELDIGEPLDTDRELITVGWSNVMSGSTGGFTGSYIFSQTLFTRRMGCESRLVGWLVALSELGVCLTAVDPLAFVPLAFFAATLVFIAVDLMVEWLYEVRGKVLTHEYLVLLATFVSIQFLGLNKGLLVGVICSVNVFVINYASERRNTLERVEKRGRVVRPATQRRLLQVHREKILCVELKGELFFGSSRQVLEHVTGMLDLGGGDANGDGRSPAAAAATAPGAVPASTSTCALNEELAQEGIFDKVKGCVQGASSAVMKHGVVLYRTIGGRREGKSKETSPIMTGSPSGSSYGSGRLGRRRSLTLSPTVSYMENNRAMYILLDCTRVTNIDASAVRTCFLPLQRLTEQNGICVVYAGLTERMMSLLSVHKAIGPENVFVFPAFFAAIDWCETRLIRHLATPKHEDGSVWANSRLSRKDSQRVGLGIEYLLRHMLDLPETSGEIEGIERYCVEERYEAGEVIFSAGDEACSFCIVTEGQVRLTTVSEGSTQRNQVGKLGGGRLACNRTNGSRPEGQGHGHLGIGAVFGYVEYQLDEPRTRSAFAETDCTVVVFTRSLIDMMMEENPRLLCLVERGIGKHLALELANARV